MQLYKLSVRFYVNNAEGKVLLGTFKAVALVFFSFLISTG